MWSRSQNWAGLSQPGNRHVRSRQRTNSACLACRGIARFGGGRRRVAYLAARRPLHNRTQQRCGQHPTAEHVARAVPCTRIAALSALAATAWLRFPRWRHRPILPRRSTYTTAFLPGLSSRCRRRSPVLRRHSRVRRRRPAPSVRRRAARPRVRGSLSQTLRAICRGALDITASGAYSRAHMLVVPATSVGEPNSTVGPDVDSRARRSAAGSYLLDQGVDGRLGFGDRQRPPAGDRVRPVRRPRRPSAHCSVIR